MKVNFDQFKKWIWRQESNGLIEDVSSKYDVMKAAFEEGYIRGYETGYEVGIEDEIDLQFERDIQDAS